MKSVVAAAAASLVLASGAMAADRPMSMAAGKGELQGSYRAPDGFKGGPAVLFIAGSGPTDRDGNSVAGVKAQPYKLLADALEQAGIPSLRYDKRGAAASMSALIGAAPLTNEAAHAAEADLRFTDYADDAVKMAQWLARQPGVRCVVILGHSEGSLLGMLAAQKTPVCGYISVAGAGRPIGEVLQEQLFAQLPKSPSGEAMGKRISDTIATLKAGHTVDNPPVPTIFRPSVQPYLISWLPLDPAVEIKKVKAATLIVQGDTDIQVNVMDAKRLAAARPDARLVVLKGMNHVWKIAPPDMAANAATYLDPALPLAPELAPAIVTFVKGLGPRH